MNVAKLKGKMVEAGKSAESLATELGIDRSSLYRKLNSIEKITVGEALKLKETLHLSDAEAIDIFLS